VWNWSQSSESWVKSAVETITDEVITLDFSTASIVLSGYTATGV
jgi:hypothetical protein